MPIRRRSCWPPASVPWPKVPTSTPLPWGASRFRKALINKQRRWMGLDLDPDVHVVVTCGSTEAMMTAMMTGL